MTNLENIKKMNVCELAIFLSEIYQDGFEQLNTVIDGIYFEDAAEIEKWLQSEK